jgi:DNA-binding transcriptional MocR family regulator
VNISLQYSISGTTVDEISASVEAAIRSDHLEPGQTLPTVRALAADLGVSPTTVASSYRELTRRGIVMGEGRRGTRVRAAPPISGRLPMAVAPGTIDLRTGGPDPALLPPLPALKALAALASPERASGHARHLYGEPAILPALAGVATVRLNADGIDASNIAVVGGALDGVERVLGAWLRPGDRVAVEDPGYTAVLDLLAALGLRIFPLALDELGVRPERLEAALDRGVAAVVLTPRAQNPTGAAWNEGRAGELRTVLRSHPDVLVVEDDHAGPAAGVALNTLCTGRARWATIRSVSKWLGPDLRLAILAGDPITVSRVEGRQALGAGWVSFLLQGIVADLWSDKKVLRDLDKVAKVYRARREALTTALYSEGISVDPRSGLTMWVPVADELAMVTGMLDQGIAVGPGERFRIDSAPGVRIAFASLKEVDAPGVAAAFGRVLKQRSVRAG